MRTSIRPHDALAYGLSQSARVAWYFAQYRLAQRLAPRIPLPPPEEGEPLSVRALLSDLGKLMAQDWGHIRAGRYKKPADMIPDPRAALSQAAAFFKDLPAVHRRRRMGMIAEPFADPHRGKLPRYYLQNFHYQSDGYLSDASAKLYDHQVEVLFVGGADTMRRQALPDLIEHLRNRPQARMVDVASGTGRFLHSLHDNLPDLTSLGIDLSPAYLTEARRQNKGKGSWVQGNAEALPVADGSMDAASCVYLFHELPKAARARALGELARVTKPGGLVVIVDSIQFGDHPPYDRLIRRFPLGFHEPYYLDYAATDLIALGQGVGLALVRVERAFFSKVIVMRREG
jgi:ubiquinone/menaquinone biosynthesis C-methylase UbiE